MIADNTPYYGDNLDVLRRHVREGSIDLSYVEPPFNGNADCNVLFAEQDGTRAAAQIKAFGDTWRWDQAAYGAHDEMIGLPCYHPHPAPSRMAIGARRGGPLSA